MLAQQRKGQKCLFALAHGVNCRRGAHKTVGGLCELTYWGQSKARWTFSKWRSDHEAVGVVMIQEQYERHTGHVVRQANQRKVSSRDRPIKSASSA